MKVKEKIFLEWSNATLGIARSVIPDKKIYHLNLFQDLHGN